MEKKSKSSKELKEVKVPMKFNVGLHKYEPELPIAEEKKESSSYKSSWNVFWIILIMILLLLSIWILSRMDLF